MKAKSFGIVILLIGSTLRLATALPTSNVASTPAIECDFQPIESGQLYDQPGEFAGTVENATRGVIDLSHAYIEFSRDPSSGGSLIYVDGAPVAEAAAEEAPTKDNDSDSQIRIGLAALRETGQNRRTLVFFFSDNSAPFGSGNGGSRPNGGQNTTLRDGKRLAGSAVRTASNLNTAVDAWFNQIARKLAFPGQ